MSDYPGYNDPSAAASKTANPKTQYIGDVPHARISAPHSIMGIGVPGVAQGYKKGDQIKLLPKNGGDLAALQQALYQAGFITASQAQQMVLGSPDDITLTAFSKLLATSNMSGASWKDTLSGRLAATAQQPPDTSSGSGTTPAPLTVSLANPDDIKATLQGVSKTLLGGDMSPEEQDAFVAQYQNAQRQQQTQAYYSQGGEQTQMPDATTMATNYAKTTDPNQYQATQFGSMVNSALNSLRSSGQLPSG